MGLAIDAEAIWVIMDDPQLVLASKGNGSGDVKIPSYIALFVVGLVLFFVAFKDGVTPRSGNNKICEGVSGLRL